VSKKDIDSLIVLWVDDQINDYSEYIEEMEQFGLTIVTADSINKSLDILKLDTNFDLILLDLRFSSGGTEVETGFSFLKATTKPRLNIPICILSSYLHLETNQNKINRIRRNAFTLDKQIPDPGTKAFEMFVNRIKYYANNPAERTPFAHQKTLEKTLQNRNPFEINFREYMEMPSRVKKKVRESAESILKDQLQREFDKGYIWVLFCGDSKKPIKAVTEESKIPSHSEIAVMGMDIDRVPFQYSTPDHIDDIATSGCSGPSKVSSYPTVTLELGGEELSVHFDTGSPFIYMSFELLTELKLTSLNGMIVDGRRSFSSYEYINEKIKAKLIDQKGTKRIGVDLNVRAVKNWDQCPFIFYCKPSCGREGEICKNRQGLVGRNLIFDNGISLEICGVEGKTSIIQRKKTKGRK